MDNVENKVSPEEIQTEENGEVAAGEMFEEDMAMTMEQRREKLRDAFKFPEESQRGLLKLFVPMHSRDKEYHELHYDFTLLSGKEVVDALDVNPDADNNSTLTNKQALFLFSMACAKMERGISGLDAIDIRAQLSPRDMLAAVRIGRSFFVHSLVGVQLSIFKM